MISRENIVAAARELIGVPYLHQGRDTRTGIDCVGLLVLIGQKIGYEEIHDLADYRRVPSSSTLLEFLNKNLEEVPLNEIQAGDFLLLTLGGRKARHTAVISSLQIDLAKGKEPMLIHALNDGNITRVIEQPIKRWQHLFVKGFQAKGLI
jgi:hypothetical protein